MSPELRSPIQAHEARDEAVVFTVIVLHLKTVIHTHTHTQGRYENDETHYSVTTSPINRDTAVAMCIKPNHTSLWLGNDPILCKHATADRSMSSTTLSHHTCANTPFLKNVSIPSECQRCKCRAKASQRDSPLQHYLLSVIKSCARLMTWFSTFAVGTKPRRGCFDKPLQAQESSQAASLVLDLSYRKNMTPMVTS